MSKKTLSTFEREMQDVEFQTSFEKEYKEFVLSEVLASLMKESHKTIRGLLKRLVSPLQSSKGLNQGNRKT